MKTHRNTVVPKRASPFADLLASQFARTLAQCALLGVAVLGSAACGPADRAPTSLSTARDSSGVTIVEGPAADVALPWVFREVHRIGGADTGAQSFTRVNVQSVSTDGASRIAILDADNNNSIHVFDSTGVWIRTVGAKGGGPGEMEYPLSMVMDGDANIVVFDIMKRALLRWDANGAVGTEQRVTRSGSVNGALPVRNGNMYASVWDNDSLSRISRLELWSPTDTLVIDSVVSPRPKMVRFSCIGIALPPLFSGELAWAVNGATVATTSQSQYVIDLREAGKPLRSIRRKITPVAAVPEDAAKLYPEGLKVMFSGGSCVTPSKEVGEKVGVAPSIPLVRRLAYDPSGRLWVERYTFTGDTPMVDVFDKDGAYLGTINDRSLPLGFLGPNTVLFPITDDATDIRMVGVYRFEPAVPEKP